MILYKNWFIKKLKPGFHKRKSQTGWNNQAVDLRGVGEKNASLMNPL